MNTFVKEHNDPYSVHLHPLQVALVFKHLFKNLIIIIIIIIIICIFRYDEIFA